MIFPDLTAVNERVSTYRCGECTYLGTAPWALHQAHYEEHRKEITHDAPRTSYTD